jgi:hypothetical protein
MTFSVLIALVILNVMAVVSLWRAAARRPARPKKQFIAALLHSDPIVPKHRRPKDSGEGFSSLVSDQDRQFFKDFDDFADVVNWWSGTSMWEPVGGCKNCQTRNANMFFRTHPSSGGDMTFSTIRFV